MDVPCFVVCMVGMYLVELYMNFIMYIVYLFSGLMKQTKFCSGSLEDQVKKYLLCGQIQTSNTMNIGVLCIKMAMS